MKKPGLQLELTNQLTCKRCRAAFDSNNHTFSFDTPAGTTVHIDVNKALRITQFRDLVEVGVAALWPQVGKYEVEAEHVEHVNLEEPILIGQLRLDQGLRDYVIDGVHRCHLAHRRNLTYVPCRVLTEVETLSCCIGIVV